MSALIESNFLPNSTQSLMICIIKLLVIQFLNDTVAWVFPVHAIFANKFFLAHLISTFPLSSTTYGHVSGIHLLQWDIYYIHRDAAGNAASDGPQHSRCLCPANYTVDLQEMNVGVIGPLKAAMRRCSVKCRCAESIQKMDERR